MPHNDCKIPRGNRVSDDIKKALEIQLKCPSCGGSFDDRHFGGNVGCNSCGIYVNIGTPFIFGNACRTNYDYLTIVRNVRKFLEHWHGRRVVCAEDFWKPIPHYNNPRWRMQG